MFTSIRSEPQSLTEKFYVHVLKNLSIILKANLIYSPYKNEAFGSLKFYSKVVSNLQQCVQVCNNKNQLNIQHLTLLNLYVGTRPGGALPILLDTDVPLRFSKHPPFIYSIFSKTIHIHIFPLKILTQSYIS
jgi:hypothetical protein